jgi:type VI secretion system protein ImpH
VEFAGAWLSLPPDQRTRLSVNGAWCRLGLDAAAGVRAWDPQARIILRIGPLDLQGFQQLLPDRAALHRLVSLIRAYLGFELGFAINPVLAAREIPPLLLTATADPPPRLGWNTWIPGAGPGVISRGDAADAVFEAEVIEAQQAPGEKVGQTIGNTMAMGQAA